MANRLPPSKRPERQPDAISADEAARKAAAVVFGTRRHFAGPGVTLEDIARTTLEAARLALSERPKGEVVRYLDLEQDGVVTRGEPCVNATGVFMLAAQRWDPMDDRRAESFYRIVEDHVRDMVASSGPSLAPES